MDAAALERTRPQLHGMVMARRFAACAFLFCVAVSLLAGLAGGLFRLGVAVAPPTAWLTRAALAHAALMLCGFFGTVIAIERAVAARHPLAWGAPLLSGAGALALLAGADGLGGWLLAAAGASFLAVNVLLLQRQVAAHTALLLVAAAAWFVGNTLLALGTPGEAVIPWWFAFLVLTVAAERLEMTRMMRHRPGAQQALFVLAGWLVLSAVACGTWPAPGQALFGGALLALAMWLIAFDIARRTVRAHGLSRYMAVCLLGGYAWLAMSGAAWIALAGGLPARDAALHALGLGFILCMVMGHAPVILPAVARVKLQFGWPFYLPLVALHATLLLRLGAGWSDFHWRSLGAIGNALALAAFALTVLGAALAWRRRHDEKPWALWALGFRPFYLLASAFTALSIVLWALQFTGQLSAPYLAGPLWHAHEMLFGFALAVIVGFLFTAGHNWTGLPTPTGGSLAALAALWLAARVLVLTPWGWASALANTAFPLAAATALAIPFVRARNRRNYFFIGLLVLLAGATLAIHLATLGVLALPAWAGLGLALDVVLFILCVMGGRVIPMFTNNGVPGAGARKQPLVEKLALSSVLALLVADALQQPEMLLAGIAAIAGLAHLARWLLWRPWRTLRNPLVWVLHVAYAWIPIHLLLRAFAALGWIASSSATHALTVGAIGGLTIAMMTRTARGHTGLPLRADRYDVTAYALIALAAPVRVFVPLAMPAQLLPAVLLSALLWSAGFALYFTAYAPRLAHPRADGRPG